MRAEVSLSVLVAIWSVSLTAYGSIYSWGIWMACICFCLTVRIWHVWCLCSLICIFSIDMGMYKCGGAYVCKYILISFVRSMAVHLLFVVLGWWGVCVICGYLYAKNDQVFHDGIVHNKVGNITLLVLWGYNHPNFYDGTNLVFSWFCRLTSLLLLCII